jgi:acetyltransferase
MEGAEMAIMVSDQWQGLGVGIALSQHCMKVAKEEGIKKISMDILIINTYMLGLSKRLGFRTIHSYDDYLEVECEIK